MADIPQIGTLTTAAVLMHKTVIFPVCYKCSEIA